MNVDTKVSDGKPPERYAFCKFLLCMGCAFLNNAVGICKVPFGKSKSEDDGFELNFYDPSRVYFVVHGEESNRKKTVIYKNAICVTAELVKVKQRKNGTRYFVELRYFQKDKFSVRVDKDMVPHVDIDKEEKKSAKAVRIAVDSTLTFKMVIEQIEAHCRQLMDFREPMFKAEPKIEEELCFWKSMENVTVALAESVTDCFSLTLSFVLGRFPKFQEMKTTFTMFKASAVGAPCPYTLPEISEELTRNEKALQEEVMKKNALEVVKNKTEKRLIRKEVEVSLPERFVAVVYKSDDKVKAKVGIYFRPSDVCDKRTRRSKTQNENKCRMEVFVEDFFDTTFAVYDTRKMMHPDKGAEYILTKETQEGNIIDSLIIGMGLNKDPDALTGVSDRSDATDEDSETDDDAIFTESTLHCLQNGEWILIPEVSNDYDVGGFEENERIEKKIDEKVISLKNQPDTIRCPASEHDNWKKHEEQIAMRLKKEQEKSACKEKIEHLKKRVSFMQSIVKKSGFNNLLVQLTESLKSKLYLLEQNYRKGEFHCTPLPAKKVKIATEEKKETRRRIVPKVTKSDEQESHMPWIPIGEILCNTDTGEVWRPGQGVPAPIEIKVKKERPETEKNDILKTPANECIVIDLTDTKKRKRKEEVAAASSAQKKIKVKEEKL